MKKISIILGVLAIVGIMAGILALTGCNSDRATVSPLQQTATPSEPSNASGGFSSTSTGVFSFDTPGAGNQITAVAERNDCRPLIQRFGSLGYSFAPDYSYVIQAYGVRDSSTTDSILVTITTLALVYTADPMRKVCYLSFASTEIGDFVQPWEVSFVNPADSSFDYIPIENRGVWLREYPVTVLTASRVIRDVAAWSWWGWAKCAGMVALAGTAGSAVGCLVSGPAYGPCLAAGAARSAVTGMVGCALNQL